MEYGKITTAPARETPCIIYRGGGRVAAWYPRTLRYPEAWLCPTMPAARRRGRATAVPHTGPNPEAPVTTCARVERGLAPPGSSR